MGAVLEVFLLSSEQKKQDSLLDVIGSVDRRCEGLGEQGEDVPSFGELVDVPDVGVCERGLSDTSSLLRGEEDDVVRDELGTKGVQLKANR